MGTDYRHKIIIDPVHGDIGLSELETKLIDTPTFQRLRKLKQLGFASMVYPNASYSRFAHSLGVLHIMGRFVRAFQRSGQGINDEDVQKLRIAALLHDIGHYPYSHLMELIDWDRYLSKYLAKKAGAGNNETCEAQPYPKHSKLGEMIITKRDDIREKLEGASVDPKEVAALIRGKHQSIPNLLHRSLDVDRMDYLVRDSLSTGVPYGHVDLNYILHNLEITSEGEAVLSYKARFAAEHLLLARYFMFNTVYLHKTVFGFEEMVRRAILIMLERGGKIYKSGREIEQMVIGKSPEFLDFHDGYIDRLIDEHASRGDTDPLTIICKAIKLRHPPALIHQVTDLYDSQRGGPSEGYIRFERCMKKELEDIATACDIHKDCLIFREPKDVEFEALSPFTMLSKARETQEPELKELVRIMESSGEVINLIEDRKSIIHHLSQLTLKVIRLYAVESDPKKIEQLKSEVTRRLS